MIPDKEVSDRATIEALESLMAKAMVPRASFQRRAILEEIHSILGLSNSCLMLLWLYDLQLDRLLLSYVSGPSIGASDVESLGHCRAKPSRHSITWTEDVLWCEKQDEARSVFGVGLDKQEALRDFCSRQGIAVEGATECIYPVPRLPTQKNVDSEPETDSEKGEKELLGVLHIIGSTCVAANTWTPSLLRIVAGFLSISVQRDREQRLQEAMRSLIETVGSAGTPIDALKKTAVVLTRQTRARFLFIYRPHPDGGFRIAAACDEQGNEVNPSLIEEAPITGKDSPIGRFFGHSGNRRLRDYEGRPSDRKKVFGTEKVDDAHDNYIRRITGADRIGAWMGGTLKVPCHEKHGALMKVAVFSLIAPQKDDYLPDCFSHTDSEILDHALMFLTAHIPSLELHQSMETISDTLSNADLTAEPDYPAYYGLLRETIGRVQAAALVSGSGDILDLGGDGNVLRTLHGAVKSSRGRGANGVRAAPYAGSGVRVWAIDIPRVRETEEEASFRLFLAADRERLTDYESKVLSYLCTQIGRIEYGRWLLEKHVREILQVRHAIRSTLAGVTGNLAIANRKYSRLRKGVNDRRRKLREVARQIFTEAEFRKALDRSTLFVERTRVLLEQSRFLLHEIDPASLRLGAHNVAAMVNDIELALRADISRRNLELVTRNGFPEGRADAVFDHELVYILLFNLIDNAVKYSYRGRLISVVLKHGRMAGASSWKCQVVNEGVFIPPENREKIFKAFLRLATNHSDTTRPGTGIGLSVCREIVKAHHRDGILDVVSDIIQDGRHPLARTVFTVELPLHISGVPLHE